MKLNTRITGILLLMICFFAMYNSVDVLADNIIRQGITVEGMDISGMTETEAKEAVDKYAEELISAKVNIKVSDEVVTVSASDLGYKWTNTSIIDDAMNIGDKGNVVLRYKDKLDIEKKGKSYSIQMNIIKDDIIAGLKEICAKYHIEAQDAYLKVTDTGFEVVPEEEGITIDYDTTAETIYKYFTEQWDKKSDIEVVADTKLDEPEYTAEELSKISDVPMGSYSTTFATGSGYYNRNMNLKNGMRLLDDIILYPGEEYSLNEHLAPWTEENGYYPAGTYVDGEVADSLGGGICQVSSTLYNALLLAELEIVERYPHSMSVAYVPLAADAALAGDYKDLKFRNNTDAPIYINATYVLGKITFDVYGHDTREEGRSIKYVSETISVKKIKTEVEKDDTKPTDYKEVVDKGHVGYVAKLWKYVYQNGEQVDKILVNTSSYRMTPKKVIKGTKKKDKDKDKDKEKETSAGIETPTSGSTEIPTEAPTEVVTEAPTEAATEGEEISDNSEATE